MKQDQDRGKMFKLRKGYCHVLPGEIRFSRDGILRKVFKTQVSYSKNWLLLACAAILAIVSYAVYDTYRVGKTFFSFLFAFFGIFIILRIFQSLNISTTPLIERSKIHKVSFQKGIAGFMRPCFTIKFFNDEGRLLTRKVFPDIQDPGESEKALNIFREEGLI